MATTSFLYHCFGVRGYRHLRTEYRSGAVFHHVEFENTKRRCSNCGARWWCLAFDGAFERTFNAVPVGSRPQFVVLHGHRQYCAECGLVRREPILFTEGKRRYLRTFARYVVSLCRLMTIADVARLLRIGWDRVKEIYKEHLQRRWRSRRLGRIRRIGVDEFAIHKGHKYMTVVLALDTGEIIYAKEGKDGDALIPFLRRLKRSKVQLKAIAIDMSAAYANAVRSVFGDDVAIVHDRYHVVALANKAVDETRRDLVRSLTGDERHYLKGTRFLWLRGAEKVEEAAFGRLMALVGQYKPLFEAWLLKELLRDFWELNDRETGDEFLDVWTLMARSTENKHLVRLAKTLDAHREGLLAYFDHPITSAQVEGTNNKIKVLKRQAYGYRDMEFFKLRLYFLHEAKVKLVG